MMLGTMPISTTVLSDRDGTLYTDGIPLSGVQRHIENNVFYM